MSKMEEMAEDLAKKALMDITDVLARHDSLVMDIPGFDHITSESFLLQGIGGVAGALIAHMMMRRKAEVTSDKAKAMLVAVVLKGLESFLAQPTVQEKIERGAKANQAAARRSMN
jgi:hypothetical protein